MVKKERKEETVSRLGVSDSLQPMDFSPPASSVHGILQTRILEWVAIPWKREWKPIQVLPGESHGQKAWQATVFGSQRVGHD